MSRWSSVSKIKSAVKSRQAEGVHTLHCETRNYRLTETAPPRSTTQSASRATARTREASCQSRVLTTSVSRITPLHRARWMSQGNSSSRLWTHLRRRTMIQVDAASSLRSTLSYERNNYLLIHPPPA